MIVLSLFDGISAGRVALERLGIIPEKYTEGVSNSQRYKMLGNSWTVDIIVHILKHFLEKE